MVTFVTGLGVGGAETALLRLLEATSQDFEHMVVSLRKDDALASAVRALGIDLHEMGLSGWFVSPSRLFDAARRVRRFRPDVIVGHMYHGAMAATAIKLIAARKSPLFWVIHHSLGGLHQESRSTRAALRVCGTVSVVPGGIVYVSRASAREHEAYGFRGDRTSVIPNGYDVTTFRPDPAARRRLRTEWGFSDSDVVVGHVARVHPMKDHVTLIAALELARATDPRLTAVLCGPGTQELVLPPAMSRMRLRLLGPRADVPDVMNACDIGVLSSAYGEAFPNVLAEFMACGVPCVTTDIGDAAMIVGDLGRVVPAREPKALAQSILDLARLDVDERASLGAAARRSIGERFAIGLVAGRHAELWQAGISHASCDRQAARLIG